MGHGRSQKFLAASFFVRDELSPVSASADMEFSGENRDQGEARPLSEAKGGKELLAGVLKRGLDAIDGG
jgi:hypothetical protein